MKLCVSDLSLSMYIPTIPTYPWVHCFFQFAVRIKWVLWVHLVSMFCDEVVEDLLAHPKVITCTPHRGPWRPCETHFTHIQQTCLTKEARERETEQGFARKTWNLTWLRVATREIEFLVKRSQVLCRSRIPTVWLSRVGGARQYYCYVWWQQDARLTPQLTPTRIVLPTRQFEAEGLLALVVHSSIIPRSGLLSIQNTLRDNLTVTWYHTRQCNMPIPLTSETAT